MGVSLRLKEAERGSFEREMWKLFSYPVLISFSMNRMSALFPLMDTRSCRRAKISRKFTDAIVSNISWDGYKRLQEANVSAKLTHTVVSNTSSCRQSCDRVIACIIVRILQTKVTIERSTHRLFPIKSGHISQYRNERVASQERFYMFNKSGIMFLCNLIRYSNNLRAFLGISWTVLLSQCVKEILKLLKLFKLLLK